MQSAFPTQTWRDFQRLEFGCCCASCGEMLCCLLPAWLCGKDSVSNIGLCSNEWATEWSITPCLRLACHPVPVIQPLFVHITREWLHRDTKLPVGTHYKHITVSKPHLICSCGFYAPQFHNLQELRHSASLANKVFIQRDYSEGTTCKFQTKFPSELESRVRWQKHPSNHTRLEVLIVAFSHNTWCDMKSLWRPSVKRINESMTERSRIHECIC